MKHRQLKRALRAAFQPPEPVGKEAFLQSLAPPAISSGAFVLQQLRYLRVPILLVSAAGFGLLAVWGLDIDPEFLWVLSAASPFLALTVLDAARRSYACGMEELEWATRFSLKSVVLARMGCLSLLNGLLLLGAVLLLGQNGIRLLKAGVALLLPYCTTVSIALPLTRRYHGKGAGYLCIFASGLVSAGVVYVRMNAVAFSAAAAGAALAAEVLFIVWESAKLIHQTEELTWNYI